MPNCQIDNTEIDRVLGEPDLITLLKNTQIAMKFCDGIISIANSNGTCYEPRISATLVVWLKSATELDTDFFRRCKIRDKFRG